ncbi:MAG: hypothetical protein M3439_07445 [Chloroflexota bacterium]|nr:hypothetical protein [Chloroflexota bacterium]
MTGKVTSTPKPAFCRILEVTIDRTAYSDYDRPLATAESLDPYDTEIDSIPTEENARDV